MARWCLIIFVAGESMGTVHIAFFSRWRSYIIEDGVCYLCLCEPSYPAGLAFEYLKAVCEEFSKQCGRRIYEAQRPYYFIEFGEFSQMKPTRDIARGCSSQSLSAVLQHTRAPHTDSNLLMQCAPFGHC